MAVIDRDKPRVIDEWKEGDSRYRIIEKGSGSNFERVFESSNRVDGMDAPIWQEEARQQPNAHGRDRDCSEPSGLLRAVIARLLSVLHQLAQAKERLPSNEA